MHTNSIVNAKEIIKNHLLRLALDEEDIQYLDIRKIIDTIE